MNRADVERIDRACAAINAFGARMVSVAVAFAGLASELETGFVVRRLEFTDYDPAPLRLALMKARPNRRWRNREVRG